MSDVIKIKPCPFCGSKGVSFYCNYSYKTRKYYVSCVCNLCGARTRGFSTDDPPEDSDRNVSACVSAASAWNARAGE